MDGDAATPKGKTPPGRLVHRAFCKALKSTTSDVDGLIEHFPECANELESISSEVDDLVAPFPEFASELPSFNKPASGPSEVSLCSSIHRFAERDQTLIFLDWDDTLFPTTEFFERLGLTSEGFGDEGKLDDEIRASLQAWRVALRTFLQEALKLSSRCTIITNARRPWVEVSVNKFVPEVKHLFGEEGLKVVYALERLNRSRELESQCMDCRPVRHRLESDGTTPEEHDEEQTLAKYHAMKGEAAAFYSQYAGQSWKNILSIGDMPYERDAAKEVAFERDPPFKEQLRTKTLVVPTSPSLSELTLSLRFSSLMLAAYVQFDGDFNLDLTQVEDPLDAISEALHMPQLAAIPFSRHAWGRVPLQQKDREVDESLADVAFTVHDAIFT